VDLSLNKNKILWVVVTIFLGALGSGLWDLAIKPFILFSIESIINISVSSFDSIQKSIYTDIASLQREITGRMILAMGMGVVSGIALMAIIRITRNKVDKPKNKPSTFSLLLSSIFILVFSLFTVAQSAYIIGKQNNYLQLVRITSPYIENQKEEEFNSRFSLISSKEEYDMIISELTSIIRENKLIIPKKLQ